MKEMSKMKRINIKCPYCGSRAYLQPSSVVYGDRADDVEAKLYVCARYPACDAYVAAHKDTLLPMARWRTETYVESVWRHIPH